MKKLHIRGVEAIEGMKVTTNDGKPGVLKYWKEPQKVGSTGRIYVTFDNDPPNKVNEYFPGVIGGVWKDDINDMYDVIGKEFEEFDFEVNPLHCKPPEGWRVKTVQSTEIEYLEINLPDDVLEADNLPKFEEVDRFIYKKHSKVVTDYIFTRKK